MVNARLANLTSDRHQHGHALTTADFGFFSWPEPGVGAYTEVRDKTLAFEQDMGLEVNGSDVLASNWADKTPKLFWRGVPMVEVRHVSRL